MSEINQQTPGPLESVERNPSSEASTYFTLAEAKNPFRTIAATTYFGDVYTGKPNSSLLCAGYNAFDKAGRQLGVDATELAKTLDIGGVVDLLDLLSRHCQEGKQIQLDRLAQELAEIMPKLP